MTMKVFWPQIDLVYRETCHSACVLQRACCNGAHYFRSSIMLFRHDLHVCHLLLVIEIKETVRIVGDQHAIGLFCMGLQPNVYLHSLKPS